MDKEYKTQLLSGHPPKAEIQINELAREGWILKTVSFNVGYFERDRKKVLFGKEANGKV